MDFVSRFKSFYRQPFNAQGSAGSWFLMVGFLMICAIAWSMILAALKRTV